MGVFLPKKMQRHVASSRAIPFRYCHFCASDPVRTRDMLIIMEGPMRWHFCSCRCIDEWQERRHDRDMLEWLKHPAKTRAKVLTEDQNAPYPNTSDCRRSLARLCSGSRVALSLPENPELP
jgi:ribosomal protein L24E